MKSLSLAVIVLTTFTTFSSLYANACSSIKELTGGCTCKDMHTSMPQGQLSPNYKSVKDFEESCNTLCANAGGVLNCYIGCDSSIDLVSCDKYNKNSFSK